MAAVATSALRYALINCVAFAFAQSTQLTKGAPIATANASTYGFSLKISEAKCVSELFKMYEKLIEK